MRSHSALNSSSVSPPQTVRKFIRLGFDALTPSSFRVGVEVLPEKIVKPSAPSNFGGCRRSFVFSNAANPSGCEILDTFTFVHDHASSCRSTSVQTQESISVYATTCSQSYPRPHWTDAREWWYRHAQIQIGSAGISYSRCQGSLVLSRSVRASA